MFLFRKVAGERGMIAGKKHIVAFVVICVLFIYRSSADGVSLVPESLESAHDIVEIRMWLRDLAQNKLKQFKEINAVGDVGDWPVTADFQKVVNLGEQVLSNPDTDWQTLGTVIETLAVLTPQNKMANNLAAQIVILPYPETIHAQELTVLEQALVVVARQGTAESLNFLLECEDPTFWQDRDRPVHLQAQTTESEGNELLSLRLRPLALQLIATYVDPVQAKSALANLAVSRRNDAFISDAISRSIEVVSKRIDS